MAVGTKEFFVTFKYVSCNNSTFSKYYVFNTIFDNIRIKDSDYFERDGADVYTEAEISVSQAILGGTVRVEGIYEDQIIEVNISIPSHEENIRIRNVFQ